MMHIAPGLPEFSERYPNLSVQIVTANRYPDFIEAGIDVAIRTREHEGDSGITVRKLADTHRFQRSGMPLVATWLERSDARIIRGCWPPCSTLQGLQ
jgi:DNA-binding transcriptional LysR family regulator